MTHNDVYMQYTNLSLIVNQPIESVEVNITFSHISLVPIIKTVNNKNLSLNHQAVCVVVISDRF